MNVNIFEEIFPKVVELRRDFHSYPEVAFEEYRTSEIIEKELKILGIETFRLTETGVVGLLDTGKEGPTIALRADIDALPLKDMKEPLKVPYVSKNDGVCHACGHDGHTAILLGTAMVLSKIKDEFTGKVKFIFQPAEERTKRIGGASILVEKGVLENPKVDSIFGLHLWTNYPTGKIGLRTGKFMASSDDFTIEIIGKGGHASAPHETVDPIVIASQVVLALQTIVSRSIKPIEPAVVTVASIHGGTGYNIIPESVTLVGTVRTFNPEVQDYIEKRIGEIVDGVTKANKATYKYTYNRGYPPVITSKEITDYVWKISEKVVGSKNVFEAEPVMGAEDFAYYLQKVPGTFALVGCRNEQKGADKPHHHPQFDIDEDALLIGTKLMVEYVLNYKSLYSQGGDIR